MPKFLQIIATFFSDNYYILPIFLLFQNKCHISPNKTNAHYTKINATFAKINAFFTQMDAQSNDPRS